MFCGVVRPKYKGFPCNHALCCLRCSGDSDLTRCPLCHARVTMLLRYDPRQPPPPPEENFQYTFPSTTPPPPPPSPADYDFHFPPLPPHPLADYDFHFPPLPPPPRECELLGPFPPPLDEYARYLGVGQRYRRSLCYGCCMKIAVWFISPCRHVLYCDRCMARCWYLCPVCASFPERAERVPSFR